MQSLVYVAGQAANTLIAQRFVHSEDGGSAGTYVNISGRNDFVTMKVTFDANYIYFYAETNNAITSPNEDDSLRSFETLLFSKKHLKKTLYRSMLF